MPAHGLAWHFIGVTAMLDYRSIDSVLCILSGALSFQVNLLPVTINVVRNGTQDLGPY